MTSDLLREGIAAKYDPDDIEKALIGPATERKRALMRLLIGSWKKGWDECYEVVLETLGEYDMAHLVESLDRRVH